LTLKERKIFLVYKILFNRYGPQGWWPTTPTDKLTPQYIINRKKLTPRESLEIATGAILTQNTSWTNVSKAIENLNRARFFNSPFSFPRRKIAELIHPAGYYNQKSGYLLNFLKLIKTKYDGDIEKLLSGPLNDLRKILLNVKGIGYETADSIILYASGKPIFVVDAYTRRILSRIFRRKIGEKIFEDYEKTRCFMEKNLPKQSKVYNEYHALLVRLAKEHCLKKNPLCKTCPLFNCRPQLCRG